MREITIDDHEGSDITFKQYDDDSDNVVVTVDNGYRGEQGIACSIYLSIDEMNSIMEWWSSR